MAITQDEQQAIINAVLSAIRTNSKTIDQLSLITSLSESDCFEIGGGKKVSFKTLNDLINSMDDHEIDLLKVDVTKIGNLTNSLTSKIQDAEVAIASLEERVQNILSGMDEIQTGVGYLQTQVGKSLQELRAEAEGLAAAVAAAARTARLATPQRVADEAALEAAAAKAEIGQQFYVAEEG